MPLLRKRSVIAYKVEGTPGTAESLTAAEGAFNAYNVQVTPSITMNLREGQSALSPLLAIAGPRSATIAYEVDLYTAPAWESMLGACGLYEASADIWTPSTVTSNWKWATVGWYMDGRFYSIKGAMGTATFQFRAGSVSRVRFEFTGPVSAWGTDVAIIAPTSPLTAASAPRWASSTLTWGGIAGAVSTLDIALNNQVTLLEDPTNATGFSRAWIASRAIGGTCDPEEALAATRDDMGNWLGATEIALSIAYGTMSFSVPKLQWTNLPTGERNGVSVLNATWQANRSAAAGDDELSIDLST